jgi:hypothetical protein
MGIGSRTTLETVSVEPGVCLGERSRRAVTATGGTILVRAEVSLKSRHRYRFDKSNRKSANRRLPPRAGRASGLKSIDERDAVVKRFLESQFLGYEKDRGDHQAVQVG